MKLTGGATSEFLPDVDYRGTWQSDWDATEAAKFAVENAKGS